MQPARLSRPIWRAATSRTPTSLLSTHLNTRTWTIAAPLASMSTTGAAATEASPPPSSSQTPVEDLIRAKLTGALAPTHLEIHNDSHLHAHHKAMAGSTSRETHFRVYITSDAFAGVRMQPARHRIVYALLKDEMAREGGIHALQLRTRTVQEDQPAEEREVAA